MSHRICKIINHLRLSELSNVTNEKKLYRYAVFIAGPLPETIVEFEGTLFEMYQDFFTRNKDLNHENEEWVFYNVTENKFPTHKELLNLSGIVITGSAADSFDDKTEWVINLRKLIKKIMNDSIYSHIKLIGICFGHQVIAHSLKGGKSYINPLKTNIHNNWEIGTREIIFNQNFRKVFPNFDPNKLSLNVLEHHRDAVISIPDNAMLLASSKWTENELYNIGDRVLSFQGHPEFTPFVIKEIADMQYKKMKTISCDTYEYAFKTMKIYPDNDIWSKLFSEWLRR